MVGQRRLILSMSNSGSPVTADDVPAGDGWLHEVKFDGYRVQIHKVGSRVVLFSRNEHKFTDRFPSIAQVLHELPVKAAVLDGEVVWPAMPTAARTSQGFGLELLRVAEQR